MQFFMPVKVWDEENCVKNHCRDWIALGTRAMIVTGGSSSTGNGSLADVRECLEEWRIPYVLFDEIEANPSVETVMKAREIGMEEGVDFVIGLGGGSAMDAAKAIALMITHKDADASYLFDGAGPSDTIPLVAIPTTCGTGSEVTGASILTLHKERTKQALAHKIFPRYALIDGRYLRTAPLSLVCNTAVDALAHLWESAVNIQSTPYSRMLVDAGLREWSRNKEVLLGQVQASADDYRSLMRASAMAGMAIAQTGTALPHGFSYPITYDTGMEHGKACGYFAAGYLSEAPSDLRKDVLQLAGFASLEEWQIFYEKICRPEQVSSEHLERAVEVLTANEAKLAQVPFPVDREALRRMAFFGV